MKQIIFLALLSPFITKAQQPDRTANFPREEVRIKQPPPKTDVWIFLMAGQSNMAGRAFVEPIDTLGDPRILSIDKEGQLVVAREPLHFYQPALAGLDCGLSFAHALLPHLPPHAVILMVPCAVGGSSIRYWLDDSLFNHMHLKTNFLEKVRLAKKYGTIKGILWHQGESDASGERVPTYKGQLKTLLSFFRQSTGDENLPIILGELGTYAKRPDWKKNWASINLIIDSIATTERNCSLVRTADLTPKEDFIHFDTRSQRLLGQRYAKAYLAMHKDGTGKPGHL